MPGIPLLTKFPDVAGAVTPVAPKVIYLLLVKILQCFLFLFFNNDNNNDNGNNNNYLGGEFIHSVKWLGCLKRWLGLYVGGDVC